MMPNQTVCDVLWKISHVERQTLSWNRSIEALLLLLCLPPCQLMILIINTVNIMAWKCFRMKTHGIRVLCLKHAFTRFRFFIKKKKKKEKEKYSLEVSFREKEVLLWFFLSLFCLYFEILMRGSPFCTSKIPSWKYTLQFPTTYSQKQFTVRKKCLWNLNVIS